MAVRSPCYDRRCRPRGLFSLGGVFMKTAILVDCDFYLRRHFAYFGDRYREDPVKMASNLIAHCMGHIDKKTDSLYRIFVYDCPPLSKKVHNPISGKAIDFSKSKTYQFRTDLHKELKKKPNTALRLGYLDESNAQWVIKDHKKHKQLLSGKINMTQIGENDIKYVAKQKGVDMKIGLDIATLTHKKLVERIVLISGDSDFVPASKLARREGINFVLDAMWHPIRDDLQEHIDRLHTTLKRKK